MPYMYSDIEAQLYDEWFEHEPFEDQAFYQYFIEQKKGRVLEIGSGTGRLLLPYVRDGLEIEGLEPSPEMIDICLKKAQQLGLAPVIHQQAMEDLSLDKKYMTIYIPFCSFQLVTDHERVQETLKKFYDHLEQDGQLLISLFIPADEPSQENVWRVRRTLQKDSEQIILSEANRNDRFEQLQIQRLKYEVFHDDQLTKTVLRTMSMRWYHTYEFLMMLRHAGFPTIETFGDYTHQEADENSEVVIWRVLKK